MNAKKVLVTRPLAQAKPMVALLQSNGFEVEHYPCLAIEAVAPQSAEGMQSKQLAMALSTFDHVIVISSNAAQRWLEITLDYWPQWPIGVQWWAMGKSTQAKLIAQGIDTLRPTTGDTSEALLLDLLPKIEANHKVLIVRGVGGRETLRQAIEGRGARVHYAACYERQTPTFTATQLCEIAQFSPQAVMLQSGETLANFDQLLGDQAWCDKASTVLVVPSLRIAKQAKAMGYQTILESTSASDQSMCDTLIKSMPT